jgi:hypothetical protein
MNTRACITAVFVFMACEAKAQQKPWDPAGIGDCEHACPVQTIDGYMNALFKRDVTLVPPLAKDVRFTENTGEMTIGEGLLWRSRTEPTGFKVYVADPVAGQVALQTRLKVQGRDTFVAIRLRIDRGTIGEIEQLYLGNVAPEAIELLTSPRSILTENIPATQRLAPDDGSGRRVVLRRARKR